MSSFRTKPRADAIGLGRALLNWHQLLKGPCTDREAVSITLVNNNLLLFYLWHKTGRTARRFLASERFLLLYNQPARQETDAGIRIQNASNFNSLTFREQIETVCDL